MTATRESEEVRTLYVSNLHQYVDEAMLQDIFSTLGKVSEVRLFKDSASGISQGSAFVKFQDQQAAALAVQTISGRVLCDKEVRIQLAFQNEKSDKSSHFHIFVGNLSGDVAGPVLLQAFQHIGDCSAARVMCDHSTGRSKGFGFVSFRTKEAAERALREMEGAEVGQWKVRCGWAHHKADAALAPLDPAAVDSADPTNNNVYIGNLSAEVSEEELRKNFEVFGEVTGVKLCHKGGYGFVAFREHACAVQAIVAMNGQELKGKAVRCSWGLHQAAKSGAPPAGLAALMGLQAGAFPAGEAALQHLYAPEAAQAQVGPALQLGAQQLQLYGGPHVHQPWAYPARLAHLMGMAGQAGAEYAMAAAAAAAAGQPFGQYGGMAPLAQPHQLPAAAFPQQQAGAGPYQQQAAQQYCYAHLHQATAPQVNPGAQPLQAGYQGQMNGMAYPGQPAQLPAAAPMAAQQFLDSIVLAD